MVRTVVSIVLASALGAVGFLAYTKFQQRQELLAVIGRLTTSTRVAQAVVTKRWTDEDGRLFTAVRFVELGPDGDPLAAPTEFVVEGDTVYFDSFVLKFDHGLVSEGDALLHLHNLRRTTQEPSVVHHVVGEHGRRWRLRLDHSRIDQRLRGRRTGWRGRGGDFEDVEVLQPAEAGEGVVEVDAAIAASVCGVARQPVLLQPMGQLRCP